MNNDVFITGVTEKYPEELLDGRINAEANVIGCIVSDMLLIEDSNIDSSKFITKDARLIFSIIKILREKKCMVFDDVSVLTYIKGDIILWLNLMISNTELGVLHLLVIRSFQILLTVLIVLLVV